MDRNAFLAFALSFLVLSLWMTYEAKHRPAPVPGVVAEQQASPTPGTAPDSGSAPAPNGAPTPASTPIAAAAPSEASEPIPAEKLFVVEHRLNRMVFTSRGAGIRHFELLSYHEAANAGGGPVVLIDRTDTEEPALATPLPELGLGDLGRADFHLVASSPQELVFERTQSGVVIRKTFLFEDDTYRFRLRLEVSNATGLAAVEPAFGVLLPVRSHPGPDFRDLTISILSQGSVEKQLLSSFGTPGLFSREPALEQRHQGEVEWAAVHSHYFLTAVMPDLPRDAVATLLAIRPGEEALVTVSQPPAAILPGTSLTREYALFFGPKEPELLSAAGAQLDRSIDLGYSWIAPLTRGFIWMLKACYSIIPNFGVAIIMLTVLVRLVTAPLAARQMKSMKRMSELQPKIKEMQEKHKDDKQAQSQEMMKMYREAGVNPLGGCLPILFQFPVFIGLYYALQSSIDLRQAPFMLWINDLSQPETLFTIPGVGWPVRVLPILMSLSMVLQQRMTPTTSMDPTQARTMMIVMPVMFFFMFYGFPSGLVLYWFVSNLLAIAQQVFLNRQMAPRPA